MHNIPIYSQDFATVIDDENLLVQEDKRKNDASAGCETKLIFFQSQEKKSFLWNPDCSFYNSQKLSSEAKFKTAWCIFNKRCWVNFPEKIMSVMTV